MTVRLGVIADDFTGATDIASFLVRAGMRTVQINQVPPPGPLPEVDAIVVSRKSRSAPITEALSATDEAYQWLRAQGTERIVNKYCSTFDSTEQGNIGPITDFLMDQLDTDFTVVIPALPINGRTVYCGNLFVNGQPLAESGMRHHPVNPMTDSNLMRLMAAQSRGQAALIDWHTITGGVDAVRQAARKLRAQGIRYAVCDTLTDADLDVLGEAFRDLPLVTGGSGIGQGLAHALVVGRTDDRPWPMLPGRTVVMSGSSSVMTNAQVADYLATGAPVWRLDVDALVEDPDRARAEIMAWVLAQDPTSAPMVCATSSPDQVRQLQDRHGAQRAAGAIEGLFADLAVGLREAGFVRFIIAGGETSGAVTQALGVSGFEVGPQIAPGVPWVRSLDGRLDLALKSGNFGDEQFFSTAVNA